MKNCLVVLTHSFRTNSRILREAFDNYSAVSVVYPSPWYWNSKERHLYKTQDCSFHHSVLNHFAHQLFQERGLPLYILKHEDPARVLEGLDNIDSILYDLPYFGGDKLKFDGAIEIDSDSYDPSCTRMTAKSRWTYWAQNRSRITKTVKDKVGAHELPFEKYSVHAEKAQDVTRDLAQVWQRVEEVLPVYSKTRNEREGSLQISKHLHHGLIDGPTLVSNILDLAPGFIDKDNPMVPLLRQLAFREISIRKSRTRDLSLTDSADDWAKSLLDEKSYQNLKKNLREPVFTKQQLMTGTTGKQTLDDEIKKCLKNRWMPNRARMWLAGEAYWGLGGGVESLSAIVEFFNANCDDGQSPNNWISCVESMRMQYGKVMRFNEKRTHRLLDGQERI